MIRTGIVSLTAMPAVAYRQKLSSGGSGVVIVSRDHEQVGIASISRSTGEAIPTANTPSVYTKAAFLEAIELTSGMPYKRLGKVKYVEKEPVEVEEVDEVLPEEVIVDSKEYLAVVDAYTDKNGKLSYDLINRDMIQFAHKSAKVGEMVAELSSEEEIRMYVAGARLRDLTGNHNLTDAQVGKILEMLDEVSPKGVLREFNDEIRKRLGASKKNQ